MKKPLAHTIFIFMLILITLSIAASTIFKALSLVILSLAIIISIVLTYLVYKNLINFEE